MKTGMPVRISMLTAALASLLLLGCGSTRPTEFYLLSPIPSPEAASSETDQDLVIGIGPLTLAEYLDRPQIVTRENENKVNLAEYHQWAEPLKENLLRLLARNLSTLLSTKQIVLFPWKGPVPMTHRVSVEVLQFERMPDGMVILEARWMVTEETKDEKTPRIGQTRIIKPAGEEDDYASLASAMSEAFADLCRKVAENLIPE
jgi:uncharacterized lipoprotein YmbA